MQPCSKHQLLSHLVQRTLNYSSQLDPTSSQTETENFNQHKSLSKYLPKTAVEQQWDSNGQRRQNCSSQREVRSRPLKERRRGQKLIRLLRQGPCFIILGRRNMKAMSSGALFLVVWNVLLSSSRICSLHRTSLFVNFCNCFILLIQSLLQPMLALNLLCS